MELPPIAFTTVVVPLGRDLWVFVPALGHTFYAGPSGAAAGDLFAAGPESGLDASIRAEVRRVLAAADLSPDDYLDLLPPRREALELLTVPVDRSERAPEGGTASLRRRLAEARRQRAAREVLGSIGTRLREDPRAEQGPELVGRDGELASLTALLGGRDRQSVLLLGPELAGKTALLFAWLHREAERTGRDVYATSGAQLIAGMSGLGQWQERLRRVMLAAEAIDAVLYFDDLADLFNDGRTGGIDLATGMRPWLQEGKVRIAGELTPEALDLHEGKNTAFFSALVRLRVEPLGAEEAAQALERRITRESELSADRPVLAREAIGVLIDLAERYLPYRPFPGKALRFYEELRSTADATPGPDGRPAPIGVDRVLDAFSARSGIPAFLLRDDRALIAEQVMAELGQRLIGQRHAIRRVVETICVVKAGLQPSGKPLATFLFIGPTGVGKTELARTLATFLFGSADRMFRLDMSEWGDAHAAERLIQGTDRSEGLLTRRVRQQPFSVLLLDEVEKAHPAVFDLLLQVTGEGRLTDTRGRTAYFHNTIIIMTSNLGATHRRSALGIEAGSSTSDEYFEREARRAFRPELVNRLDRIITFHELTPEEVAQVAHLALARLQRRRGFSEAGLELQVSPAALAKLVEGGYSEADGARALRRHLEDHLAAPIARLLGRSGAVPRGTRVEVDVVADADARVARRGRNGRGSPPGGSLSHRGLVFELRGGEGPGQDAPAARAGRRLQEVLALRRTATRWLGLDRVHQLRQQQQLLGSKLSAPLLGSAASDRRSAQELAELEAELRRVSQVWDRLSRAHVDVLAAEELVVGALFEGEGPAEYFDMLESAFSRLGRELVYGLVALESGRDELTMMLIELDDGRALDLWLLPLLRSAARRDWTVALHHQRERGSTSPGWPQSRPFGPPEPVERVVEDLSDRSRPPTSVLLRVRGPWAGSLLARESGLHRYIKVHPDVNPVHMLAISAFNRFETTDQDWLSASLTPPRIAATLDHTRQRAVREYDGTHHRLHLRGRPRPLSLKLAEYWDHLEDLVREQLLAEEEEHDRRLYQGARLDPS